MNGTRGGMVVVLFVIHTAFRSKSRRRAKAETPHPCRGELQLHVVGGLGEVGGAAEVAPIVVVGAEGEDFFALGGEAEIGGDDGEDPFFGEHG